MQPTISKVEALIKFGKKLGDLITSKSYTYKSLAENLSMSYSHLINLLGGKKAPSAEVIYEFKDVLKLTNMEVGNLSILEDTLYVDDEGKKYVQVLYADRSSERTSGRVEEVSETNLQQFPEYYNKNDFINSAAKYVYNEHYKEKFNEIENELERQEKLLKTRNTDTLAPGPLRDIIETLIDLDNETLTYIKANIQTYLDYHNRRT